MASGVFSTSVKDGTVERGMSLATELVALMSMYHPDVVSYEGPSMPPNAGSAWKIGVAFGVLAGELAGFRGEHRRFTPAAIKEAVLPGWGARKKAAKKKDGAKASRSTKNGAIGKEQVIRAIKRRWFKDIKWPKRKAEHEHIADAAGAVVAFLTARPKGVAD
jgi:hypothetical protein